MRILTIAALAAGALVAPVASAQTATGLEFVGCWTTPGTETAARLCVLPEPGPALRFVTIAPDGTQRESSLRLDGERTAIDANGCEGWEQARPSADRERLVVDAQLTCGGVAQKRTTVFSITPAGYFLQTTGTGIAMVANTQLQMYAPVTTYIDIPSALRAPLVTLMPEAEARRLAIRGAEVSSRDLVELDEMGVAGALIDVVVASAYPRSFVIDATGGVAGTMEQGQVASGRRPSPSPLSGFGVMGGFPMLSMYDWEMMRACAFFGGYSCAYGYGAFNYGRFGYGYGAGYYGFGYGYPGFWPGANPVVVRPVATQPPSQSPGGNTGGRAVRGRGYTQNGSDGMSATPRASVGASSMGSTGSGSGSGASSTAGSSSGTSSGGRTAKPRDP